MSFQDAVPSESRRPSRKTRILIVDDDKTHRFVISELLEPDFEMCEAQSLGGALSALEQNKPDCVLLDYKLGAVDGLSLIQPLQETGVAVVFMTACGSEDIAKQAIKNGAHDYVSKNGLTREALERGILHAVDSAETQKLLARNARELETRHAHHAAMLEALPATYLRLREDGWVVEVGGAPRAGFDSDGVDFATFAGGSVFDKLPQKAAEQMRSTLASAFADDRVRTTIISVPGPLQERVLEAAIRAYGESEALAIVRDVTGRAQLEARSRAAARIDAGVRVAAGTAHEFNNALMVIQTYVRFAVETLPEEAPAHEDLQIAMQATRRAAALTRQLLEVGNQAPHAPETVPLIGLIQDSLSTVIAELPPHIQLEPVFECTDAHVRVDALQLREAVLSLISNARDAMPDGGVVSLQIRHVDVDGEVDAWSDPIPAGSYFVVAVGDRGTGVTAEVRERMFEPFFTTREPASHSGLGLSTCHGTVRQNAGYLRVTSVVGKGTTVEILLPKVSCNLERDRISAELPRGLESDRLVLVVDDEEYVRIAVARVLSQSGFKVLQAESGETALELLEANPDIALLLTDVVMPQMRGDALAEVARQRCAGLRVVFMSGYPANAVLDGKADTSAGFVLKPCTPTALVAAVNEALAGS